MNMRVAVAGCRRESDPVDLYPDLDVPPVRAALAALGADSVWVSWDDPGVCWSQFDRVLISGTWDSVDRPVEYLAWAREVSDLSTLVNHVPFIEWNIDKRYLLDLAADGVSTIPTVWVRPGQSWQPPPFEFVIKPSISAGGRQTACYSTEDQAAADHMAELHSAGHTAMVQPYIASIPTDGEVDLVFVGGQLQHAFRRRLTLQIGTGVVTQPWQQIVIDGVLTPAPEQVAVARAAMESVEGRLGQRPSYARVDLVAGPNADSLVVEVELIDPYLALDLAPTTAYSLAQGLISID
jgi:hypothetical protein